MAEKPGELNNVDKLDPVSTAAGAGRDPFLEKYSEDDEVRELAATGDDSVYETEQIRAQIEETRNQMGETIDAIQDRLSYAHISEQVSETVGNAIETAKDTAYDATIGKAVNFMKNIGDGVGNSNAFQTVRRNPFPFALIGIGAGLLAYQTIGGRRAKRFGNASSRQLRGDWQTQGETGREGRIGAVGGAFNAVSERASAAADAVTGAAGGAVSGVRNAFGRAYSDTGEIVHHAYERAGELGHVALEKYDEYIEEHPLAVGALALGIGAAIGFAIPSSEYEGRVMGEARETFVQRAQDAAGSLVDKAKQVASEAGETIKQETRTLSH